MGWAAPYVAVDASGNATASSLYAPYGGSRYRTGTMPTDYGFTGQHADNVTGLDYYNARYYDPTVGQFTTADTILPGGGYDMFGLSRYAYVEGNPMSRMDPSGHVVQCVDTCNLDPLPPAPPRSAQIHGFRLADLGGFRRAFYCRASSASSEEKTDLTVGGRRSGAL